MAGPKLVAVGDNCLDVYLDKNFLTVGGNALNVAVHWQRRGLDARYFGAVGDDREGEIVLDEIFAAGLARNDVELLAGDTAVTFLRDEKGDRKFVFESLGVGQNYVPTSEHYSVIARAQWVHLGTNSSEDLVRRLAKDGVPFSVDVSTAHSSLQLDGVPLVFASGSDDLTAPIEPPIAALMGAGARQVVLTCGSRGSFFQDEAGLHHAKAMSVRVVDTCGAGDSFIAAFTTAYCIEGLEPDRALQIASIAGGETCSYQGGFPQGLRPIPRWLLSKYAGISGVC